MKYCLDNDFISVPLKNDLYESMNEFYEQFISEEEKGGGND